MHSSLLFMTLGLLANPAISLPTKAKDGSTNWHAKSASSAAFTVDRRKEANSWKPDSAAGVADWPNKRESSQDSNWYSDSASGMVELLASDERDEGTDWYSDSAAGMVDSLDKREGNEKTNWYSDTASGMVESLAKRFSMSNAEKKRYEKALREWIYYDMRGKSLRESSERGKAFFEFTPKPRNDVADRWHVPIELQERFNASDSDAERVSILNYYLMVTGREPKPAKELGFTPTADAPGLTETNEVGYGYALAGQHQYHCVDFVADAIDIGKERLNDFFLKHTIHCLGLLKWLSPKLTMKQPNSFLLEAANKRLLEHYPQILDRADAMH